MIKVAIIDDHVVVRAGLKYVIASDEEFVFVGEHGGGVGAVEFVRSAMPDVTLLDVRMPDQDGVTTLRQLLAADPRIRVIMLTTSDLEEDVFRAIEAGALGYVMKESPVEEILAAIRSAMRGDVYMSDDVRKIYETRKGTKALSPRESEVLTGAGQGLNNREIGEKLGISENSVKMMLKRAFFKLGANDRTEAYSLAVKRGFIQG